MSYEVLNYKKDRKKLLLHDVYLIMVLCISAIGICLVQCPTPSYSPLNCKKLVTEQVLFLLHFSTLHMLYAIAAFDLKLIITYSL